ncbi:class III lanthionine synthetase LanKC N-terminal domain-containing protein [Jiangella endophytica]|uniref:class III lanthionine synthetase LanKC N-terminal domain-containing protein n=1 Tax=Jiangella endophytica TaxID=1623398 RepID=UPI000E340E0A|nr:phosphotransferase [Jiangella endophytica]
MRAPNFFWHPYVFEPLASRPPSDEYSNQLLTLLPDNWLISRYDVWLHATPEDSGSGTQRQQGFKIHISAIPQNASTVLGVVAPICADWRVDFKVAGDPTILQVLNSKRQSRGGSGKFITIYPPDDAAFRGLIEQLYQATRSAGVVGPHILSDRRYKDSSVVHYRYGGFSSPKRVNLDGTHTPCLVSPAGVFEPDDRRPYFQLPGWVEDPFGRSGEINVDSSLALNGRYTIESAVSFSNAGGIYVGIDAAGRTPVIIKEARPFTHHWSIGETTWDAVDLLHREHAILRRLAGLPFVPTVVEIFEDSGHTFLVEQRLPGRSLRHYWARNEIILAPYIRRPHRLAQWLPLFTHVAERLIAMVLAVHERGVLLGDLSPANVMIDDDGEQVGLIDFESAVTVDDGPEIRGFAAAWRTPGFAAPDRGQRGELGPDDDFYAAAMVLYHAVVPVNPLFGLQPGAMELFLDRFVRLGVPDEVRQLIHLLVDGRPRAAQALLREWRVAT